VIASSFASILPSTTSSRVTSLEPTTDSAFLISLFMRHALGLKENNLQVHDWLKVHQSCPSTSYRDISFGTQHPSRGRERIVTLICHASF